MNTGAKEFYVNFLDIYLLLVKKLLKPIVIVIFSPPFNFN